MKQGEKRQKGEKRRVGETKVISKGGKLPGYVVNSSSNSNKQQPTGLLGSVDRGAIGHGTVQYGMVRYSTAITHVNLLYNNATH